MQGQHGLLAHQGLRVSQAGDDAREQSGSGVGARQRGQRGQRGRDDQEVVRGEVAAQGVDEQDDEVGSGVEEQGAGEVRGLFVFVFVI